ncbi:15 kDa protein B-like [Callospermophilus lateralis]|uniref:15 kDa protein B-like n=1 Tax=Callospermophilus lateralis TaxID=76772 RepID=UPI0040545037
MAGAWKALVLVVGFAVVSCEAHRRLRYEDFVNRAVNIYNRGQRGKPLFRLLEAIPPRLNFTIRIPLNFTIKETVCISTPRSQPQECAFREGGEERTCTGESSRRRVSFLILTCDRVCENPTQVNRVIRSDDDPVEDFLGNLPPAAREAYEKSQVRHHLQHPE